MASDRVIVVDDNLVNLELISFLLEEEGFDVATVVDAEEALRKLDEFVPEILVIDVQLPGMSGLDFLRKVRERPELNGVCAVVVTSYAMDADRERAFAAGCNGYITKPIDTRTFVNEIRGYRTMQVRAD